jgi:hypothetical protein
VALAQLQHAQVHGRGHGLLAASQQFAAHRPLHAAKKRQQGVKTLSRVMDLISVHRP